MKKFGKKILATVVAATMAFSMVACGGASNTSSSNNSNNSDSAAPADNASSGEKIKVGIINNDPNESGYRTANMATMLHLLTA